MNNNKRMKISMLVFSVILEILFQPLLATISPQCMVANLTNWRQHRRQKRFILFEHSGICKLVTGITYPVNLGDKMPWRQLVLTMNLQYQFPVPPRPYYWWERWDDRSLTASGKVKKQLHEHHITTDDAQLFLYKFTEELMKKRGMNGRACMQRAICENVQIHKHNGLFAELLHRILIPHKSLDSHYIDALHMGRHGINCSAAFPDAKICLLDSFLHVREEILEQTFLI